MFSTLHLIAKQIKVSNTAKLGNKLILVSCQSTSLILFTFCAITTSQQYFGKPIQCIQDSNSVSGSVPENVMNSFCFTSHTYSLVDFKENNQNKGTTENLTKHSYYPWVPILTFLQGLSFMAPLMLWAVNENSYLVQILKQSTIFLEQSSILRMARYISQRLNDFGGWSTTNLFSEITFAANIIGNFILVDTFLGGRFMDYGYKVILEDNMYGETIFPKMTKCRFFKYGPSGSMENRDALCLMTLNIVNEKLYLFLWFWFLLLLVVSSFILTRRIFFIFLLLLRNKCNYCIKKLLADDISRGGFAVLVKKLSTSDWLLLEQIKCHLDTKIYFQLLENIILELRGPQDLILNSLDMNQMNNYYDYVAIRDP